MGAVEPCLETITSLSGVAGRGGTPDFVSAYNPDTHPSMSATSTIAVSHSSALPGVSV